MLEITVVDKDKVYELNSKYEQAFVFFIQMKDEKRVPYSYVSVKNDEITKSNFVKACRKSSNEIILIYDLVSSIELHACGFYNVQRYEGLDKDKILLQNVDNLKSAKEWVSNGKALFSLGVAHVVIDSVNYVVTMYVPSHYAVRFGNIEAFVVL